MWFVFTRMPGQSYHRRYRSLLLYLCYVFLTLINSLVCWFCMRLKVVKVPQPGVVSVLIYAVILILIHFLSFACPTPITWLMLHQYEPNVVIITCSPWSGGVDWEVGVVSIQGLPLANLLHVLQWLARCDTWKYIYSFQRCILCVCAWYGRLFVLLYTCIPTVFSYSHKSN